MNTLTPDQIIMIIGGIGVISLVAWIVAVVVDGNNRKFGWLAIDIMVPPIGVVRGLLKMILFFF